jgi:hypothetical protein
MRYFAVIEVVSRFFIATPEGLALVEISEFYVVEV